MAPFATEARQTMPCRGDPPPADLNQANCPHDHTHDQDAETCISAPPLRLQTVLDRFAREAVHGTVDTGRYRCSYFSWGTGAPLVFIHGLGDDARSFVMPVARLSDHFRCICYELPRGNGDGAHLGRYHHADFVADLFALIDHLGLRRAYLFGSSFGSTVALKAMHQQPARFPRGVLQGGFARRPLATREGLLASWARYWPWYMNQLPFRLAVLRQAHFGPFATRQAEVWKFFLERDGFIPMEAVARRALILNHMDLRPLLPQIRQPLLLICGDEDPLVGKSCEQELVDGLPNATRAELSGCGHMPHFTHPEIMAELTSQFLLPPDTDAIREARAELRSKLAR